MPAFLAEAQKIALPVAVIVAALVYFEVLSPGKNAPGFLLPKAA